MSNWTSIFPKILHGVEEVGKEAGRVAMIAEPIAEPFINAMMPGAGAALNGVFQLVKMAQEVHPATADGAKLGATRKQWVTNGINIGLPIFQSVLKQHGEILTLDGDALSETIDNAVALLNSFERLHSSFSLTKVAAPAAA